MSRRLIVVGGRRGVGVGFVAGLGLNLSLDLAEVLLHLSDVVVGQHHRMPAVLPSPRAIQGRLFEMSRRREGLGQADGRPDQRLLRGLPHAGRPSQRPDPLTLDLGWARGLPAGWSSAERSVVRGLPCRGRDGGSGQRRLRDRRERAGLSRIGAQRPRLRREGTEYPLGGECHSERVRRPASVTSSCRRRASYGCRAPAGC